MPISNKENIDVTLLSIAPKQALDIIGQLSNSGYEAYLVGGCVRDIIEGNIPHDWDITTSATPKQMKAAVNHHAIDTGLQHGTITFIVDGQPYETTVFRTEGEYSDGRHPDSVSFAATVEEDLARRDFTVNAMAWSPSRGLVDPYNGFNDLNNNLLRGVGIAEERFREDGLRIMRAVRFAATHGYKIEDDTAKAMHNTLSMLSNISEERITTEFIKMLSSNDGKHMADIFREFKDVMYTAIPELRILDDFEQDNPNHDRSLLEHCLDTMSVLPNDPILRFAGLVHDIGKPSSKTFGEDGIAHYWGHMETGRDIVHAMCKRMKMSNEDTERLSFFVANHDKRPRETQRSARRFLVKMGSEKMLEDMLMLMEADIRAHSQVSVDYVIPRFERAKEFLEAERVKALAMKPNELAINGDTLIDMGWKPGPEMGAAINEMFSLVVDGDLPNNEEHLRAYAKSIEKEIKNGERILAEDKKAFIKTDGSICGRNIDDIKADCTINRNNSVGNIANMSLGKSEGKIYVSPHVRSGVKVEGYYRAVPKR